MISNLIDRIFGKPTQESVAQQLTALIQAKGGNHVRFDAAQGMLHYVCNGGSGMTNVTTIYNEVVNTPRNQRQAVVQRYFEGVWQQGDQLPNTYDEAMPLLRPVIRTNNEVAINAMRIDAISEDKPARSTVAYRQFTQDLDVLLVIDLPNSMSQVMDTQLKSWGVTFDQALNDALENLRKMTDESQWVQAGDGVWVGQWNDAYESSRLLLPDLIYRLGISEPVAMVPFRNTLFVTAAGNSQGVEQIAQFVVENHEGPRKHLSFELLALKDKEWHVALEQPQSLAKVRMLDRHGAYDQQKTLLEQRYTRLKEDVFVATFNAMQKSDGSVLSYATWSKGVDTLLPMADLIVFVNTEAEAQHHPLPWATVVEHFGELMTPTGDIPPRWRVSAYPDEAALAAVAQKTPT